MFLVTEKNEKGVVFSADENFFYYLRIAKMKEASAALNQLKLLPAEPYEENVQKEHKYTVPNFPTSNTTYYVTNENANLGYALASADLNNDGLDDLVVGAPVYSELNKYQNGAVFVVFADPKSGSVPLQNLNLDKFANIVIKPPSDSVGGRFGHAVAVLDLNLDGYKDIVISAPSYDLRNINYEVSKRFD